MQNELLSSSLCHDKSHLKKNKQNLAKIYDKKTTRRVEHSKLQLGKQKNWTRTIWWIGIKRWKLRRSTENYLKKKRREKGLSDKCGPYSFSSSMHARRVARTVDDSCAHIVLLHRTSLRSFVRPCVQAYAHRVWVNECTDGPQLSPCLAIPLPIGTDRAIFDIA